jgi:hypothetical protein
MLNFINQCSLSLIVYMATKFAYIVDFLDLLDVRLYVFMEAQHFELSSFLIKYFTY